MLRPRGLRTGTLGSSMSNSRGSSPHDWNGPARPSGGSGFVCGPFGYQVAAGPNDSQWTPWRASGAHISAHMFPLAFVRDGTVGRRFSPRPLKPGTWVELENGTMPPDGPKIARALIAPCPHINAHWGPGRVSGAAGFSPSFLKAGPRQRWPRGPTESRSPLAADWLDGSRLLFPVQARSRMFAIDLACHWPPRAVGIVWWRIAPSKAQLSLQVAR
jgi:hypothetical protein